MIGRTILADASGKESRRIDAPAALPRTSSTPNEGVTMRENTVKKKLKQGKPSFGIWLNAPDCDRIDFYAQFGFEFVLIDGEHKPVTPAKCLELVRACEAV